MTLDQIKQAVQQGKTVHWSNESYIVVKDNHNQWLIVYCASTKADAIGLTWRDGVTLNGKEDDFYVVE